MNASKILNSTKFIGDRIRQGIKLSGKNQKEVANNIGVTEAWLSGIINGHQNPSLDVIEKLSTLLDQPVAFFFPAYSLKGISAEDKALATSIYDDIAALTPDDLKALKVITQAMRERLEGKQ